MAIWDEGAPGRNLEVRAFVALLCPTSLCAGLNYTKTLHVDRMECQSLPNSSSQLQVPGTHFPHLEQPLRPGLAQGHQDRWSSSNLGFQWLEQVPVKAKCLQMSSLFSSRYFPQGPDN